MRAPWRSNTSNSTPEAPRPAILVATKLDKLPASQRLVEVAKIKAAAGRPVVGVSSETGEGRERLWNRLVSAAGIGA